jgi:hypothetical protein
MTLGELQRGDVFRTQDGKLWVYQRVGGGHHPIEVCRLGVYDRVTMPLTEPVEPLDLPALLEEHALFRRLLADAGQDQGYAIGVWAERGEVVRLLEGKTKRLRQGRAAEQEAENYWNAQLCLAALTALEDALATVRARGPAATPDPPARLAERVLELEGALRGLLADAEAAEEYWHGTDPAEVLPSVLAARAALGTK